MLRFKSYLAERRRGGEKKNPRIPVTFALNPYKNDKDVFITYTQIEKVGINPGSQYNTPNGIYTYPLKEAWEKYLVPGKGILNVPFAGDSSWVNAIKIKSNAKVIRDIGVSYSSKDWDEDVLKLAKIFINHPFSKKNWVPILSMLQGVNLYDKVEKDFVGVRKDWYFENRENVIWNLFKAIKQHAMFSAYSQTIGGQMWNLTRELATIIKHTEMIEMDTIDGNSGMDEFEISIQRLEKPLDLSDQTRMFTFRSHSGFRKTAPNVWTDLWLKMGYVGVIDRSENGIIHEAEPIQGVFFTTKAFDVLGRFMNKGYEKVNMGGGLYILSGLRIGKDELVHKLKKFLHKDQYKSLCAIIIFHKINQILAKFLTSIGASAKDGDTPEYIINRTTDNKIWLEVYQIDPFVPNSSRTVVEFLEDVIKIYPDNSTPSKSKTFKYDKIMPPFALEKDLATTLKKQSYIKMGMMLDKSIAALLGNMIEDVLGIKK